MIYWLNIFVERQRQWQTISALNKMVSREKSQTKTSTLGRCVNKLCLLQDSQMEKVYKHIQYNLVNYNTSAVELSPLLQC